MNQTIPDFTETELWGVSTTLKERYGHEIELELADAELRLSPEVRTTTPCPTVYWQADDTNFVVFKLGEKHYRCQFYFRGFQQFGTGRDDYDDITECVTTLLQVEADHRRQQSQADER